MKLLTAIALGLLAGLAASACASSSSGSAHNPGAAHSVIASATADPQVQADIARAKTQVINPCVTRSTGPSTFIACVKAAIPKAQRAAVGRCLLKAGQADHPGSSFDGKQKFLYTDAPVCAAAGLPGPAPSPSKS